MSLQFFVYADVAHLLLFTIKYGFKVNLGAKMTFKRSSTCLFSNSDSICSTSFVHVVPNLKPINA